MKNEVAGSRFERCLLRKASGENHVPIASSHYIRIDPVAQLKIFSESKIVTKNICTFRSNHTP